MAIYHIKSTVKPPADQWHRQGVRGGGGGGGRPPTNVFQSGSKSDEKLLGGGGGGIFVSGLRCINSASTELCSEIRFYKLK